MNTMRDPDQHGSTYRERRMQIMELPAKPIQSARYVPRLSFWGSHRDAIITVIVVVVAFLILWGDIHLFAVGI